MTFSTRAFLLSLAITAVSAQWGPGHWGPDDYDSDNDDYDFFDFFNAFRLGLTRSELESRRKLIIAHGVLAALAFVIFFPMGSIMIRLGSFRGIAVIHGIFQLFAYAVYIAAFGIGIWLVNNLPGNLLDSHAHPILGIVVFALLLFQPFLGLVHHLKFKKYSRRTFWSYGHLWLGRIAITLGMINGGLGLHLASETPIRLFQDNRRLKIAYGVVAGVIWLVWIAAAVFGERKRAAAKRAVTTANEHAAQKEADLDEGAQTPPPYKEKEHYAYHADA